MDGSLCLRSQTNQGYIDPVSKIKINLPAFDDTVAQGAKSELQRALQPLCSVGASVATGVVSDVSNPSVREWAS